MPTPLPWPSLFALWLANSVPLLGTMLLGWSIGDVVFIYWCESIVIGVFCVLRMRLAALPPKDPNGDTIGGFVGFYGSYVLAHGIFVFGFFVFSDPTEETTGVDALLGVGSGLNPESLWAALALVISHMVSHRLNYVGRQEYRHLSIDDLIYQPIPRVLAMHAAIFGGGLLVVVTEQAHAFLGTLVGCKIVLDTAAHCHEHAKFRARPKGHPAPPA